jgi:hypothetical protein
MMRQHINVESCINDGAVGTHRRVAVVLGAYLAIITRAWIRYQQYGKPVRRHGGGMVEADKG